MGSTPDGRDRDAVAAHARAAGIAQHLRGADHVVVVLEGLALALEHDARDRPLRRLAADGEHLLDHLPGLEVAREAEPARLAEARRRARSPTCDETHTLQRGRSSGMRTASKTLAVRARGTGT